MGQFFFKAGLWVSKAFKPFFKNVHPGQAVGILGTGWTLGGIWDSITGLFSDTANQGAVNEDDEMTLMEQLEQALKSAGTAVTTAGFLFVVLVAVLGWKQFKKAVK